MPVRLTPRQVLIVGTWLFVAGCGSALGASPQAPARSGPDQSVRTPSPIEVGQAIVVRDCSACHATGVTGQGAFPGAPPFRTLGSRYDLDNLAEALAEGISVGHPAMPERAYPARDVEAIITYLKSVQPHAGSAGPPLNPTGPGS